MEWKQSSREDSNIRPGRYPNFPEHRVSPALLNEQMAKQDGAVSKFHDIVSNVWRPYPASKEGASSPTDLLVALCYLTAYNIEPHSLQLFFTVPPMVPREMFRDTGPTVKIGQKLTRFIHSSSSDANKMIQFRFKVFVVWISFSIF